MLNFLGREKTGFCAKTIPQLTGKNARALDTISVSVPIFPGISMSDPRDTSSEIDSEIGDAPELAAVDKAFAEVYDELRKLARSELRRGQGNTLYTTELVHEAYLKVSRKEKLTFENEVKFFKYAAVAMRHILVDRASRRARVKLGGDLSRVDFSHPDVEQVANDPDLALQLEAALRELEKKDSRAASVVELHYFAGLSLERVGELLGVVTRTVDRDWLYARAFLEAYISSDA
jgi:RNA polymerase sigma factor (TIGR02999 family)